MLRFLHCSSIEEVEVVFSFSIGLHNSSVVLPSTFCKNMEHLQPAILLTTHSISLGPGFDGSKGGGLGAWPDGLGFVVVVVGLTAK